MKSHELDGPERDLRTGSVAGEIDTALASTQASSALAAAHRAQREINALAAENSGLRADVDSLLAELDTAQAELRALRSTTDNILPTPDHTSTHEIARLREELTAAQAQADRAAHERDVVRSELAHHRAEAAQRQEQSVREHALELAALNQQMAQLHHALRLTNAQSATEQYRSNVEAHTHSLHQSVLQNHTALVHQVAHAIEGARMNQARHAVWLESELDATKQTVSWRATKPLRAVRGGVGNVAATLSGGAWSTTAKRSLPDPSGIAIPHPVPARSESPLLDVEHYRRCYPSLALFDDHELLEHYVRFGQSEGRSALSPLGRSQILTSPDDHTQVHIIVLLLGERSESEHQDFSALIDQLSLDYHVVSVVSPQTERADDWSALAGTVVVLSDENSFVADDFRALAAELNVMANPAYAISFGQSRSPLAEALDSPALPVIDVAELSQFEGIAAHLSTPISVELLSRSASQERFSYAASLDELAARAARSLAQRENDLRRILRPDGIDAGFLSNSPASDRVAVAREYLRQVRINTPLGEPNGVVQLTRPRPGFHPLVYAESAPDFIDDGRDPFAHFLDAGEPAGRWSQRLITPSDAITQAPSELSVLVHGHFYYPYLATEFLDLLAENTHPTTLVLTTQTTALARELEALAKAHPAGQNCTVLVVPNRGRNLAALLRGPVSALVREHDLVLHVHGKRSPHAPDDYGRSWRRHLWTHLVGDGTAFADEIIAEFASSPQLGIVAPEDRRLHDWDRDREFVAPWLDRLGSGLADSMAIPTHFDFALGAMFWARSAALEPFISAELRETDFPAEPVPTDGTALHALERLIPLVVEARGYEFAKTYLGTPSS